MHVEDVVAPHGVSHLPDGLEEGQALDVSHRSAHLDDNDVRVGFFRQADKPVLDFVGQMRHGLDGAAEKVAAPLPGDQFEVGLTRCHVAVPGQLDVDKPLVMSEVQVGLAAVLGYEDLAVLVRGHGPRVDVQVRVQFDDGYRETLAFQDAPN